MLNLNLALSDTGQTLMLPYQENLKVEAIIDKLVAKNNFSS